MIYNDVDAEHLGGGIIVFRRAVSFDSQWAVEFAEQQISTERAEMYTSTIDPETGNPAYLNKSGYVFDARGVEEMPRRGSQIHRIDRQDVLEFLDFIEESKDKYLLKYFVRFPLAYKNVWWKVKGHLVSYSVEHGGKFLGPHSDTSADYAYGMPEPVDQLATRNTISCVVYLNEDFIGGHHYFNYLDIDYVPQTGDILMFPSNYIAAHEVTPVVSGSRYSYLGWYAHGTANPVVNEHVVDPALQPDLARKATNVYMPSLRQDLKDYLDKIGIDKSSHIYQLVRSMHST
jgi:hypothetical protein